MTVASPPSGVVEQAERLRRRLAVGGPLAGAPVGTVPILWNNADLPELRLGTGADLVLDDIAEKEELQPEEGELSEYLIRQAPRYGMTPDAFAQALVEAGQVPAIMGEVVRAKALAKVLDSAKVVDTAGNVVDLDALADS